MYHFHKIIEIGQQEGARNFVQLFFNSGPLCNVKKCTNEFLDPKIPYLDTKVIEIGQQEGAINFVQFFSILAHCAMSKSAPMNSLTPKSPI